MIVAIIAGGSGTRLWPLSTPEFPKHLLSLRGTQTLLQETYSRARRLTDDVYIITEKSHAGEVKKQLPRAKQHHLIVEPTRRGTASCIMFALHHIKQRHNPDEPVVLFHADHYMSDIDGFILTAQTAAKASAEAKQITLIGMEPRYPATSLGYIKKGKRIGDGYDLPVYQVDQFKEKPDRTTAQEYLSSGHYLWNMGLFSGPVAVFEAAVKKYNPQLFKNYQSLSSSHNPDQA